MRPFLLFLLACSDYELKTSDEAAGTGTGTTCEVETTFSVATEADCTVDPVVGTFTPVVEWQWDTQLDGYDDIMATPSVANLNDDNGDRLVDEDDVPDVVFATFAGGAYTSAGAITATSGDGSGDLWSILDAGGYHFYSSSGVAIGDLQGDGKPEVCVAGLETSVVCLNNDGTLLWASGTAPYGYGCPAIADIEGDGKAEVIFGREVFEADGTQRMSGTDGAGWWMSFAVDIDNDRRLDIVAGNTVYHDDGTLLYTDGTPDGPSAVADFDADGRPEVVHVSGGIVYLVNGLGMVLWQVSVPGGGGGPPTIADFDGDGAPEIGIAGASYYSLFDTDGTVLWSNAVQDYSSSVTGSSVFDFEGDGLADVVYADEITLWVYDGATGAVKLQEEGHASGTLYEYPLIVDVDNDGASEIVLASNDYTFDGWNGITVIGDANNSWRPSRPIWNQYAYFISNVENDGSIPEDPENNWETWNSFRAGGTDLGLSTDLADLSPSAPEGCEQVCPGDGTVSLLIPVQNSGLLGTREFSVRLYHGSDTLAEETLLLAAGEGVTVGPFVVTREEWRGDPLRVDVDVDRVVEECSEANNELDLGDWPCE